MPATPHSLDLPLRPVSGDSDWFHESRFGMFIHWGLYALPARHEWVKQHEKLTNEQYEKYFKHFDPDLYDPEQWAEAAQRAGMKYFVITTKHHEGFCLWDTAQTDYKSTNTPAKRDLLRPMVEAFRSRGMRVGLYHSLIDWHHPDFIIDDMHALRHHPERAARNEGRDQAKYAAYLREQVKELLTQYGKIDMLFFDFSYPSRPDWTTESGQPFVGKGHLDWESERLVEMVRELQPQILVNDRLDLAQNPRGWDYTTPEQYQPTGWKVENGQRVPWEACQTFSGSWGYHRDESSWKSVDQLLQMLIDSVAKGGNLLLNVGPTGRGEFDTRSMDRLKGMGEWMHRHGRSIYGCTMAPKEFTAPDDCRLTYNAEKKRLYIHVLNWPFELVHMKGLGGQIEYAQLLNDASEVKFKTPDASEHHTTMSEPLQGDLTTFTLPIRKPDVAVPVIEVFLK